MFQVERLRVVNETLHQIYKELDEGNIEYKEMLKTLIATTSLTALNIALKLDDSEVEENEDS